MKRRKTTTRLARIILSLLMLFAAPLPARVDTKPPAAAPAAAGKIDWVAPYQEGLTKARLERRPLLIKFYADWCGPCRLLEQEVFTRPEMIEDLAAYVCVKVDTDREPEVALAWSVSPIPRVVLVNVHGQLIGDITGYGGYPAFRDFFLQANRQVADKLAEAATLPEVRAERGNPAQAQQAHALVERGEHRELFQLLKTGDAASRKLAREEIGKNYAAFRPLLLDGLSDPYLGVRIDALTLLQIHEQAAFEFDPWAEPRIREAQAGKIRNALNPPADQPEM